MSRSWTLALLVAVSFAQQARAEEHSALESRLLAGLKYLASDELGGRGVGTEGLDKAADYIRNEFSQAGLRTDLFDGRPFQQLEITLKSELGPTEQNRLALIGPVSDSDEDQKPVNFELGKEFNSLAIGGNIAVDAPLAFVGYGITAADVGYDDYADIDVQGKAVIILRKEPGQGKQQSPFGGKSPSRNAYFTTKIDNAVKHGAAAVIFVNDKYGVDSAAKSSQKKWNDALDQLVKKRTEFSEIESPSVEQTAKHQGELIELVGELQRFADALESDHDDILTVQGAGTQPKHAKLPVFFARRALVDRAVKAALGQDLTALEAAIDEGPRPHSQLMEGWTANCEANIVQTKTKIKNVAGVLEGEGPLADETIIVGAHYDHLGEGGPGSLAPWTKAIHNGADDNASGTTALLEIARRMASRKKSPARRVVFMAFSGEERGLLGSAYYVKQPAIPIEKTVAMVNMDMIGRLKDNKLIVYGTGTAESFDSLVDETNKRYAFAIKKEPNGHGPSDHQSFYQAKVPVFHFFTGTHKDYHRPSDDFDKINIEGMAKITNMVGDIVESLADRAAAPKYLQVKRPPRGSGNRPYLGTVPDLARDVEGYALQSVTEDGPAQQAGIKGGDVIVKFGETPISSLDDIDQALRKHKPGDEVKVIVLRDDNEIEVSVKLARPR
ncbi:MAG: aminopeptidase [Planctomycetaceae bacterium]|nr:aminopeptidase [Planctomycetaceae bacterium]